MENRAYALVASVFIILLTAALIAAAVWVSGQGRPLRVYDLVTGLPLNKLDARAPVQFQGVVVGSVRSIRFDPAHPGTTIVRVAIDADTPITRGTYAELLYQGATAIPYVLLVDPDPTAPPLYTDNQHPTRIAIVPTGLDETGEIAKIAMGHLGEMARRLKLLLAADNRSSITLTLAHLEAVSRELHDFQAQLAPALQGMSATSRQARAIQQQTQVLGEDVRHLTVALQQRAASLRRLSTHAAAFRRLGAEARQDLARDTLPRVQALGQRLGGNGSRAASPAGGGGGGLPDPGELGFAPAR